MSCIPILNEIQGKQKKSKDIHSQQQKKTDCKNGNLTFIYNSKHI